MNSTNQLNIYECFDPTGDQVTFICDGHIDSETFRDKCYHDYFVKPLVVQHQWQALRKTPGRKLGKKFIKGVTRSVLCRPWERGATPVTVGLV